MLDELAIFRTAYISPLFSVNLLVIIPQSSSKKSTFFLVTGVFFHFPKFVSAFSVNVLTLLPVLPNLLIVSFIISMRLSLALGSLEYVLKSIFASTSLPFLLKSFKIILGNSFLLCTVTFLPYSKSMVETVPPLIII
uniref:Uncharacterized protein n=1 Tax=viral metagenome TaxID=1070528 RepID=A0A6C0BEM3_9ZZZZ